MDYYIPHWLSSVALRDLLEVTGSLERLGVSAGGVWAPSSQLRAQFFFIRWHFDLTFSHRIRSQLTVYLLIGLGSGARPLGISRSHDQAARKNRRHIPGVNRESSESL